jgi:hypothetical protein
MELIAIFSNYKSALEAPIKDLSIYLLISEKHSIRSLIMKEQHETDHSHWVQGLVTVSIGHPILLKTLVVLASFQSLYIKAKARCSFNI